MVCGVANTPAVSKLIVSPLAASKMACRSEPAPLSLLLITVSVLNMGAALATNRCCCHSARPSRQVKIIPSKVSFFMGLLLAHRVRRSD
jgi:hypothetical protein